MHPVKIGKEEVTLWDYKGNHLLNHEVIGQLLCGNTLAIDDKGYIIVVNYDYKLFHKATKEILFHYTTECMYDLERDELLPTIDEVRVIFQKAYIFTKGEFDKKKKDSNLYPINMVPFDTNLENINKLFQSIQDYNPNK